MSRQPISVVLPVFNEHENIGACLRGLGSALSAHDHEILVCYDFDADSTLPAIAAMADKPPSVRLVKNTLGRGAAFAIRAGFAAAQGDVVVTTMADLCDPPEVIPRMAEKIRVEGADVVAGSRYMQGGSQSGGPWLKRTISRWVGWSMWWIANLGTHDATTNFRAYSKRFLDTVKVESQTSFDIALELTVKAHLAGRKVSEVPSSWIDRTAGESRFRMWKWMPNYLRWYVRAMAAPIFVLTVWAAMFGSAIRFVRQYGNPVPAWDELQLARYLVPDEPITASWLWSPHNEHRIPIAKLVYLGLAHAFSDIRAVQYAEVCVLGFVALAMIFTAQRMRGRASFSDAFFPLLWLHLGNAFNLLSGFQISLILPVALVSGALMFAVRRGGTPSRSAVLGFGACTLLLPLTGGHGMAQLPPLLAWLFFAGVACARSLGADVRKVGRILLATGVAAAALGAFYFVDFELQPTIPYEHDPVRIASVAVQFVTLSIGPRASKLWPASGLVVLSLCALTLVLLYRVMRDRPSERLRASAILACMLGVFCMAATCGWSRAGLSPHSGFDARYVSLPSNLLCCVYFAWCAYGSPAIGRVVRFSLFAIMCALLPSHAEFGVECATPRKRASDALLIDARAGVPIPTLVHKYWRELYMSRAGFDERLRELQRAGFAPFDTDATPPAVELPADPANSTAVPSGSRSLNPIIELDVDDRTVCSVRPPGELRFDVPPGARAMSGQFGIHPSAYDLGTRVSARFTVELVEKDGRVQILFDRALDPVSEKDRGFQGFSVSLPDGLDGDLVLRTSVVRGADSDRTWSFWSDLKFSADPPSDGQH
jgi:glycosyltransferase involved in cell wall biosynthesis